MSPIRAPYFEQLPAWPAQGRHILAQRGVESVVVYQAFKPSAVDAAVSQDCFIAGFSLEPRVAWRSTS